MKKRVQKAQSTQAMHERRSTHMRLDRKQTRACGEHAAAQNVHQTRKSVSVLVRLAYNNATEAVQTFCIGSAWNFTRKRWILVFSMKLTKNPLAHILDAVTTSTDMYLQKSALPQQCFVHTFKYFLFLL